MFAKYLVTQRAKINLVFGNACLAMIIAGDHCGDLGQAASGEKFEWLNRLSKKTYELTEVLVPRKVFGVIKYISQIES